MQQIANPPVVLAAELAVSHMHHDARDCNCALQQIVNSPVVLAAVLGKQSTLRLMPKHDGILATAADPLLSRLPQLARVLPPPEVLATEARGRPVRRAACSSFC